MRIENIRLYQINLPLRAPFKGAFGVIHSKKHILVEVSSEGCTGWAEAPTLPHPFYTESDHTMCFHSLEHHCIPLIHGKEISNPNKVSDMLSMITGNNISKAAIEMACWDLYAKIIHKPLYELFGGDKKVIETSGVVGILSPDEILKRVELFSEKKIKRVKIKIDRNFAIHTIQKIVEQFPNIQFSVDANGAFTRDDIGKLRALDELKLAMIEQPFGGDNFVSHSVLNEFITTPICLDESIRSEDDLETAVCMQSCSVVSIKPPCVGGHWNASKLLQRVHDKGLQAYCGGMFEAGIGRAHNVAFASTPGFTLPAEISDEGSYYERDILTESFKLNADGVYEVPQGYGIGVEPDLDYVRSITERKFSIE